MKRFLLALLLPIFCLVPLVGADTTPPLQSIKESQPAKKFKPSYTINVQYPVWKNLPQAAQQAANQASKAVVDRELKSFRKEYAEVHWEGPADIGFYLEMAPQVTHVSSDVIGIIYQGSLYLGGAHPSPLFSSLLLDGKTGKALPLSAGFRKDTPWLKTLSDFCYKQLIKQIGKDADLDWLKQGCAPKLENFTVVVPAKGGFQVIFPPYQVGPYAAGPQEVTVPYSLLRPYFSGPFKNLK